MLVGVGDFGGDNFILLAGVFPLMFIDHRRVSGPVAKSRTQAEGGVEWATRPQGLKP